MVKKIDDEYPDKNPSPSPPPGGVASPPTGKSRAMQIAKYVFGAIVFMALVSLIF